MTKIQNKKIATEAARHSPRRSESQQGGGARRSWAEDSEKEAEK